MSLSESKKKIKSIIGLLSIPIAILIFVAYCNATKCEYDFCSVQYVASDYDFCFVSSHAPSDFALSQNNTFTATAQFSGINHFSTGSFSLFRNEAQNQFHRLFNLLRAKQIVAVVHHINKYYIFALNRMSN